MTPKTGVTDADTETVASGPANSTSAPSWQTASKESTASGNETAQPTSQTPAPAVPESRDALLDRARQFLDRGEVRDKPTDEKIDFLESKGLSREEIKELLGVERNTEASSVPETQAKTVQPQATHASAIAKTQAEPQPTSTSTSTPTPAPNGPPIITYPEFLTTPTQPAPLITARRLLMTLYFFSTLSLAFYGTSKYLVTPMIDALTVARLSLSETAQDNLDKMIAKLQKLVSVDPGPPASAYVDQDEDDSSAGDPTELFHRDVGVQTDPPVSPTTAAAGSLTTETDALEHQMKRLSVLRARVHTLVETSKGDERDHKDLSATVTGLKDYLDSMAYVAPSYTFGSGGLYQPSSVLRKSEENDAISQVKSQIRGVKGMLLSARSFPAGVRGIR